MALGLSMQAAPSISFISSVRGNSNFLPPSSVSFPRPSHTNSKVGGLTITCVRVGGVEIPNNKRVEYSLQYIHGIGRSLSKKILSDLSLENKVTKDLEEDELIQLRKALNDYMIEGDLRRFNARAIQQLKEIRCYRGIRHTKGLPCRGQRTRSNCRTLKGKRVPIAGKKKAPK